MERLEAKQVTGNTYYYDSRWAKIDGTAYACGSMISMPHWARSKFVLIHEVCHVLCGRYYGEDTIAAHGAEVAGLQVAMVTNFLGEQDGQELHQAYTRCGVKHSTCGGELVADSSLKQIESPPMHLAERSDLKLRGAHEIVSELLP